MAVGVVERARDLGGDPHRVGDGELLLAIQPVPEALALDERHHVVGRALHLARVDEPEDVRMLQRGDRPDLAHEPVGPDHRGQLGAQDLDRDLAVVLEIVGEVDRGHAALAQLPLDAVAVGERSRKRRDSISHGAPVAPPTGRTSGCRAAE